MSRLLTRVGATSTGYTGDTARSAGTGSADRRAPLGAWGDVASVYKRSAIVVLRLDADRHDPRSALVDARNRSRPWDAAATARPLVGHSRQRWGQAIDRTSDSGSARSPGGVPALSSRQRVASKT